MARPGPGWNKGTKPPSDPHPFLQKLGTDIERLSHAMDRKHKFQLEQATKVPNRFVTVHGLTVPDPTQPVPVPVQIAPGRLDRDTIIISNTGMFALVVGNTPFNTENNGFTIAAGGQLNMFAKDAVFGWVTGGNTTTVDILETLYDLDQVFERDFKPDLEARFDSAKLDTIGPIQTDKDTGIDEIQWADTEYGKR